MTHWKSIHECLAMGGYAKTVWGCYGLLAASVILLTWTAKKRYRRLVSALRVRAEKQGCQ